MITFFYLSIISIKGNTWVGALTFSQCKFMQIFYISHKNISLIQKCSCLETCKSLEMALEIIYFKKSVMMES